MHIEPGSPTILEIKLNKHYVVYGLKLIQMSIVLQNKDIIKQWTMGVIILSQQ